MEYVGEILSKKDFALRTKKYAENKARHFYFMGLGPDEVSLSLLLFSVHFVHHF